MASWREEREREREREVKEETRKRARVSAPLFLNMQVTFIFLKQTFVYIKWAKCKISDLEVLC